MKAEPAAPVARTSVPLELFQGTMGRFPAAVSIITTRHDGELAAMTATAVTSYSASPPSMLCSIDHSAQSHPLLHGCARFAINVLRREQADTALAFARSDRAKFDRPELVDDEAFGVPVIAGSLATLVCERTLTHSHLDHSVLVGLVLGGRQNATAQPLVYAQRAFWGLVAADGAPG